VARSKVTGVAVAPETVRGPGSMVRARTRAGSLSTAILSTGCRVPAAGYSELRIGGSWPFWYPLMPWGWSSASTRTNVLAFLLATWTVQTMSATVLPSTSEPMVISSPWAVGQLSAPVSG
jgi:hypothetical protein